MFFDPYLIITALSMCAKVFSYCTQFQMMTGIDVMSLLINNQLSHEAMIIIVQTVNSNMLNIATNIPLNDADLWELLRYVIQESGNSNIISAQLLIDLGLFTNSIIAYLISFGYIIQ